MQYNLHIYLFFGPTSDDPVLPRWQHHELCGDVVAECRPLRRAVDITQVAKVLRSTMRSIQKRRALAVATSDYAFNGAYVR